MIVERISIVILFRYRGRYSTILNQSMFFFRLGLELMNRPKSYSNRNRTTAVFHLIEKLFLRNFHDKKFQRYLVPIVLCPDHLMKIIGNDNEFSLEKVEFVIKTRSKTSYVHIVTIFISTLLKNIF